MLYVVPVLRADGLHEMRMNQEVGRRYPAHAGATGKVLIAHLPEEQRAALVDRLELQSLTADTVTERAALRSDLETIARLGVGVTLGERVPDAVAISAPVFDAEGRAAAALTISGIASRYEPRPADHRRARGQARGGADLGGAGQPARRTARSRAADEITVAGTPARLALEAMCAAAWDGQRVQPYS